MKASQFNVFFKYEEKHLGYNSLSKEYIMLDPLLVELFNNGRLKNNFSELEVIHNKFYNFLIEKGFLVNPDVDEFEIVKKISSSVDNNPETFELIINPTMNCNFKCWYCYETHIKDSKMSQETIKNVIKFSENIIETQKGLKHFNMSFFGGEPLLYFEKVIHPILKAVYLKCKSKGISFGCGMTTNGLLITKEMLGVCKLYGLGGFQITLDGNRERHDKVRFISEGKGSYDKIVANIIQSAEQEIHVNVRINCSPETIPGLSEVLEDFDKLDESVKRFITIDLHTVWQVEESLDIELDAFRNELRRRNINTSSGTHESVLSSCYGDKRYQATINYNGEVFKCTARDFKDGSGEGLLDNNGEISWNNRFEERLNSKFKNEPCKTCKILPMCGGGCTQQALEHKGVDYCVYGFDEDAKTRQVVNKFISLLQEQ